MYIFFSVPLLSFFFFDLSSPSPGQAGGLGPLLAVDVIFCKGDFVLFCNPLAGVLAARAEGLGPLGAFCAMFLQ